MLGWWIFDSAIPDLGITTLKICGGYLFRKDTLNKRIKREDKQ